MLSRTLALASASLARAGFGGLIEVVFDVVGGDAEGFGAGEPGARAAGASKKTGEAKPGVAADSWELVISARRGTSQKGFRSRRERKLLQNSGSLLGFQHVQAEQEWISPPAPASVAGAGEGEALRGLTWATGRRGALCQTRAPAPVALAMLHDKQSERDHRELRIDKVGVRGLRFPIQVRDKARAVQNTVATIGMFVDLPKEFKGTHMSRFIEVLNAHGNVIHVENITDILHAMQEKFQAATSHLEIEFPVFHGEEGAGDAARKSVMDYLARFDAAACRKDMCSC